MEQRLDSDSGPLFIFDCDGLLYTHTRKCIQKYKEAAIRVIMAYYDLSGQEAQTLQKESFQLYRDNFRLVLEQYPGRRWNENDLTRAFCFLFRKDILGVQDPSIPQLLNGLRDKGQIAILSHSTTLAVQMMGVNLGISPGILMNHTYGVDFRAITGGGPQLKKDNGPETWEWICQKYGVHPSQAVIFEDTPLNLKHAKDAGLQTVHVTAGNRVVEGEYIDHSFKTTAEAIRHFVQTVSNPAQVLALR